MTKDQQLPQDDYQQEFIIDSQFLYYIHPLHSPRAITTVIKFDGKK